MQYEMFRLKKLNTVIIWLFSEINEAPSKNKLFHQIQR